MHGFGLLNPALNQGHELGVEFVVLYHVDHSPSQAHPADGINPNQSLVIKVDNSIPAALAHQHGVLGGSIPFASTYGGFYIVSGLNRAEAVELSDKRHQLMTVAKNISQRFFEDRGFRSLSEHQIALWLPKGSPAPSEMLNSISHPYGGGSGDAPKPVLSFYMKAGDPCTRDKTGSIILETLFAESAPFSRSEYGNVQITIVSMGSCVSADRLSMKTILALADDLRTTLEK